MKKLLGILLLFGCSQGESQKIGHALGQTTDHVQSAESDDKASEVESSLPNDYNNFLSFFRPVTFDTLHIYSDDSGDRILIERAVPAKYLGYFPEPIRLGATEWNVDSVYAVYRFAYSPTITALIARVPSQYSSSAFSLFLFSNKSQKLIHSQRIAEFTGDAGAAFTEESWLLNLNDDKFLDIITKSKDIYPIDEELTKFTQYDSTYIYLGTDTGFSKSQKFLDKAKAFKYKEIRDFR